jgi:[ribosomal protein S5]-alanine N-acetyltransferase
MPRKSIPLAKLKLRGGEIYLRPPETTDFYEFRELMKKSAPRFRGLVGKFKGKKQFGEYLQRCGRDDFFGFLICRNEDDVVVGNINLFHIVRRGLQSACLGYLIGALYWRQGYATEALQLMLRFAFGKLKLHRVEANIQPGNIPSIALVRRLGFSNEGFSPRYIKIGGKWRDHERWALLVENWCK